MWQTAAGGKARTVRRVVQVILDYGEGGCCIDCKAIVFGRTSAKNGKAHRFPRPQTLRSWWPRVEVEPGGDPISIRRTRTFKMFGFTQSRA